MKRILLALLLAGCAARPERLPFYQSRELTPEWLTPAEARDAHRIRPFELPDQDGRTVGMRELRGRVHVASFFYTSCHQVCPRLRSSLARVQDAFAGDAGVALVSFTVDPGRDTEGVLRRYARVNRVRSGRWHLLRGSEAQIRDLAARSYFVELSDETGNTAGDLLHTETLVLVDGEGRIRGVYNGTRAYDVTQLIGDIRTLRAAG